MIVAGPHVRGSAARHLKDLEEGPARGLHWDLAAASRAVGFFCDLLTLNGGQWEGVPFVPLGWQQFCIGSLFGWKNALGFRRFRTAYIETGKGSGKSPMAAGIALYCQTSDNEFRAEVYAAATTREQARVLFADAVAMVDASPILSAEILPRGPRGKEHELYYIPTKSSFKIVSSDKQKSGPRPHCAVLDEIHEHRDNTVVELIRSGTKGRRQALICLITNSGSQKNSVAGEYHTQAVNVASGMVENDAFFSFVCALDEGDDPLENPDCWPKANPSLQEADIPGVQYISELVAEARGMPGKKAVVRRLNFCVWSESANPWIGAEIWLSAADQVDPDLLKGRRCFGGLDLSSTTDLTSLVLVFEPVPADPVWRMVSYFWTPADTLLEREERDQVNYSAWVEDGYLEALPGRAINHRAVIERLKTITADYELVLMAYDDWRIEAFKILLEEEGLELPMFNFRQGYKSMAPAVDEFELRLLNCDLCHDGNPVLTWNAAGTIAINDPAGNRKFDKSKSTWRIDGMVAAVMAIGVSIPKPEDGEPEADLDEILRNVIKA